MKKLIKPKDRKMRILRNLTNNQSNFLPFSQSGIIYVLTGYISVNSLIYFMKRILNIFYPIIIVLLFTAILFASSVVFAQDEVSQRERELQRELESVEEEIRKQEVILNEERRKQVSLERDVAVLTAQIERALLNIQAKNITIQQLGRDINIRTETIEELEEKIEDSRQSLAHLIKRANEFGSYSMVEVLLSNKNLSEFFVDMDKFYTIQDTLNNTLEEIRIARSMNQEQRSQLSVRQNQEIDARKVIEEERRSIERDEAEKQRLLSLTEAQAAEYQRELDMRERRAAEIRSALFALRDTADIPFGEALEYAKVAQRSTGIRPAFLLGVFQQESGLRDGRFGVNVGTCNRPGDDQKWKDIMPGPEHYKNYVANGNSCSGANSPCSWRDDQTIYLKLMQELGRDPDTQPLSCPWQGGWGGAMGPAQFIPVTWNEYKSRIAQAAGVSVPDPWNPKHAFIASALYLRDLGAASGGYTAEREAALRYYAGGNWNSPSNAFYGDGVMQNAERIQADIDILEGI